MTAVIKTGAMDEIDSKQAWEEGTAFNPPKEHHETINVGTTSGVKYDLLDKPLQGTGLTRKTVALMIQGIHPDVFQ